MTTSGPLARVEEAHRLLAQARTVDEVKGVRDQAAAAALYAKERGYSQEIIDYASEIKVRAERKAGEILVELERTPAAERHISGKPAANTSEYQHALREADIDERTGRRWQEIARVEEPVFEQAVREVKSEGRGITTAAVMRTAEAKVQRDVMQTVAEAVPGAEDRIAQARLKAVFSRAIVDVRRNLLALDPEAVYTTLDQSDLTSLRAVLSDLENWLHHMRAIDAQPMRAIK